MLSNALKIFIGFDQIESVAFHTCVQSIIDHASVPVAIHPLSLNNLKQLYREDHSDGSNEFIYSRFLVPYLSDFSGTSLFVDGDMIITTDVKELFDKASPEKAVHVVKHDYKTKAAVKYLGNRNENYPRKNWSSVILWNCSHRSHKILTPDHVAKSSGAYLHRLSWINDSDIGDLDREWNWLVGEYEPNPNAKLLHYTLGTPCFKDYQTCDQSDLWQHYYNRSQQGVE
jgi:lipopolysaccharide biosynthesis glycosyltransferase